jgi:hypothetical protein
MAVSQVGLCKTEGFIASLLAFKGDWYGYQILRFCHAAKGVSPATCRLIRRGIPLLFDQILPASLKKGYKGYGTGHSGSYWASASLVTSSEHEVQRISRQKTGQPGLRLNRITHLEKYQVYKVENGS